MHNQAVSFVKTGVLDIAYHDLGPKDGLPVFLMHGFPYDVYAYGEVSSLLSGRGLRCIVPYLRGYGDTQFISKDTMRSGQQAAKAHDLLELMNALEIEKAILAGYDWGGRAACIVAALWPERARGLVSCGAGYNIQNIALANEPDTPEAEHRFWYQYYFHTQKGRNALRQNRKELCRYIWKVWSPTWHFDEATYDQSCSSFKNPDFVDIVLHSYRHRYGLVDGDTQYDETEERLAESPLISVPTIVLEGQDDGVDPPDDKAFNSEKFSDLRARKICSGVGHNFPQEAPETFADAILELAMS